MKRAFCFFALFFILHQSRSAICRWDGEGFSNQWLDPLNWVNDQLPRADDDVLLDNSIVAAGYDVFLPSGDVSILVRSLVMIPSLPSLIRLILPALNTSLTAFRAAGPDDAIVIGDGAQVINESGAATSSTPLAVTGAGTFRINNGGRYIHRTARSATDNLVSKLSTAPGTERGVFEFDVTVASYIVSLSGRTFGTLELNAATNAAMVNYRGSGGNPLSVRGDLILHKDVTFTLSLSSATQIGADLVTAAASTFNLQSTDNNNVIRVAGSCNVQGSIIESGTGYPSLELNGVEQQRLNLSHALKQEVTLVIDNAQGCMLLDSLFIPFRLHLVKGNVLATAGSTLVFNEGSTYVRNDGIAECPVTRYGNSDFVFPVGAGNIYAPLDLPEAGISAVQPVTVEYKRRNPLTAVGNTIIQTGAVVIDHISTVEYWQVTPPVEAAGRVAVSVNPESFCSDLSNTLIVGSSGSSWSSPGSSVSTGPVPAGSFETGTLISEPLAQSCSWFTIGTSLPVAINPLPVNLITFNADGQDKPMLRFRWEVSEPPSSTAVFYISSVDSGYPSGRTAVHTVRGQTSYDVQVPRSGERVQHYQLTLVDGQQVIFKSRSITIIASEIYKAFELVIYPNPAGDNTQVKILSSEKPVTELVIADVSGSIIRRINIRMWMGSNLIPLSLKDLPSGLYFLRGISSAGFSKPVRLIRR